MWRYFKAAFFAGPDVPGLGRVPVNILALAGFAALGLVNPGFWLLGLGLEGAYLFGLSSHRGFQQHVKAEEAKANRQQGTETAETAANRLLGALPNRLRKQFEELRTHCHELRQLALQINDPHETAPDAPLQEMQMTGLDRLLWIYLRLLFTLHCMDRFLEQTGAAELQGEIRSTEERLKSLPAEDRDSQAFKKRKALEDNLETLQARLSNVRKAQETHEIIELEIERLENKIRSLSETGVNRHDPEFLSGRVDEVASSMVQTERTMNELQFLTGLETVEEGVPQLMRRETVKGRG
jgi:hypothetical protein